MEGWIVGVIVTVILGALAIVEGRRSYREVRRVRGEIQQLRKKFRVVPKRKEKRPEEESDAYEFIRDVTVPDGSDVRVAEEFVKIWEIRNTGNVTWKRRYLQRQGAREGPGLISSSAKVPIPTTEPGETVQVKLAMKAPLTPGTTTCKWEMVDKRGNMYFSERPLNLFTTINVVKKD